MAAFDPFAGSPAATPALNLFTAARANKFADDSYDPFAALKQSLAQPSAAAAVDPTLAAQDPNPPQVDPNVPGAADAGMAPMLPPAANGRTAPTPLDVIMAKLQGSSRNSADIQKQGIQSLQDRIKQLNETPTQKGGLSRALAMAADTWAGGNGRFSQFDATSNPLLTETQKQQQISALQDTLRKSTNDLSDSDMNFLKMQLQYELGKGKINAKGTGGKPLPSTVMEQLAGLDAAGKNVDQSEALANKFNAGKGGGYLTAAQANFPGNPAYDYANAQGALKGQILGNLTKARLNPKTLGLGDDYLPGAIDAPDSIKSKIANSRQVIADKKQALLDLARSQGYNVDSLAQPSTGLTADEAAEMAALQAKHGFK